MRRFRNNLKISNLDYLLDFNQKYDSYKSPIEILAELEKQIKYLKVIPDEMITIEYKDFGFAMFELESFFKDGDSITFTFEFTGFVS